MSLTSKQIDELREYAKGRKGELAKLITDAADTIEELSAKLHASQMERSSQFYHDGWIPCEERMPEDNSQVSGCVHQYSERVLITIEDQYDNNRWVYDAHTIDGKWMLELPRYCKIIAWRPMPEPYKEGAQECQT